MQIELTEEELIEIVKCLEERKWSRQQSGRMDFCKMDALSDRIRVAREAFTRAESERREG